MGELCSCFKAWSYWLFVLYLIDGGRHRDLEMEWQEQQQQLVQRYWNCIIREKKDMWNSDKKNWNEIGWNLGASVNNWSFVF